MTMSCRTYRTRAAVTTGGALLAALIATGTAWAQGPDADAAPRDSADVRRDAEEAQAEFERERVARLPWTWGTASGECDEVVGRFCYWHDAGGSWEPPPPDPGIEAARGALFERLAEAAHALPGDGWIAGQRVRYLVEAGREAQAAEAARSSRADPAWRLALEGYALHAAGEFAAAEHAFDRALAALPAEERAQWTDFALLLDPSLARAWRRLGGPGKELFARRLWWLADPLWSVPGNERRTEHFARVTLARLQEDARSAYDVAWGSDLAELTMRYGWPVGWERARPRSGTLGSSARPGVVAHDAPGARRFVPPHDVFIAPEEAAPGSWPLEPEAPRSTYAPSYADSVVELTHQLGVFRRGDRAVVVARALGAPDAALFVASGPGAEPVAARGAGDAPLLVEAPWGPAVVSVEARAGRWAARARYGLLLPAPGISDLLLLEPGASLPATLAEAAARAKAEPAATPVERMGVYFEVYPPPGGGAARFTVSVRDVRGGFGRRLAAALGLGARARETALSWSEPLPAGVEALSRAVVLTLPGLPRGRHEVILEVELPGAAPATSRRSIEIR